MEERVIVTQFIDDVNIVSPLWSVYRDSFADVDDYCAQDQLCYDEKTLGETMKDSDYWKFILLVDNAPVGFCLLTNNMRKARIAYCNDRFYIKKFPNYVRQGRLYYVTAICVLPEMQKRGVGIKIIEAIAQLTLTNSALVAFDYSETKIRWLPRLILDVANRSAPATEMVFDKQVYTSAYFIHNGKPD